MSCDVLFTNKEPRFNRKSQQKLHKKGSRVKFLNISKINY